MLFGSAGLLFLCALLCAARGGAGSFIACAVLCACLGACASFLPRIIPKWCRPLLIPAILLQLLPLWQDLLPELGTFRTPIFFALVILSVGCMAFGGKRLLPLAAPILVGLAALCCLGCLTGSVSLPAMWNENGPYGILCAVFCPLAAAFLLPSVGKASSIARLSRVLMAVLLAAAFALPALLFDTPFWSTAALLLAAPLAAAGELRILCGKSA